MSLSEPASQKPTNGECLPTSVTYTITTIPAENGLIDSPEATSDCSVREDSKSSSRDLHIESSDLSDGEGDVEIEHITGVYDQALPGNAGSNINQNSLCRGKRTVINIWQKAILEDFYRIGMTSASMQLISLHTAAAEKTGLDPEVIKNWIRNRRRPTAARTAEKIANLISTNSMPPPPPAVLPLAHAIPSVSSAPISVTPVTLPTHPPSNIVDMSAAPPSAKRPHMEQSTMTTPFANVVRNSHEVTPSLIASKPQQEDSQLLVKVRLSEIDAEDFAEVEVPSLTYQSLFGAICAEFELAPSSVAKIRKLPNVLVRKDKDVWRLKEGQELEVILKPKYQDDQSHVVNLLHDSPHFVNQH